MTFEESGYVRLANDGYVQVFKRMRMVFVSVECNEISGFKI